jgi:hypothetical protein
MPRQLGVNQNGRIHNNRASKYPLNHDVNPLPEHGDYEYMKPQSISKNRILPAEKYQLIISGQNPNIGGRHNSITSTGHQTHHKQ